MAQAGRSRSATSSWSSTGRRDPSGINTGSVDRPHPDRLWSTTVGCRWPIDGLRAQMDGLRGRELARFAVDAA